jgi:predicted glycogen debranching enzyme
MRENGLIYSGVQGKALTWMDAVVYGKPVTPRIGYDVEINALWYNAIMFALEVAKKARDKDFVAQWEELSKLISKSFIETFWSDEKRYLADYVDDEQQHWEVRPNMVFAASLPFSMIDEDKMRLVLRRIEKELLTPKGLRTLSPNHPSYKGTYEGNQEQRDNAYHQGTVWPWLLGHYVEAYLKLYGKQGIPYAEKIFHGFEEDMTIAGLGSISEIYDADPPYHPRGAISQAWSVAEILRIKCMIETYRNKED